MCEDTVPCSQCMYGPVRLWYAPGALLVRLRFTGGTLLVCSSLCGAVRFGSVGAVRSAYYWLCVHAQSFACLGFVHVANSCDVKSTHAMHKMTRMPLCVLTRKIAFLRSID